MQAADHFACSQVERHEVKSECSTVGELKHRGRKMQAVITGIIELPIWGGIKRCKYMVMLWDFPCCIVMLILWDFPCTSALLRYCCGIFIVIVHCLDW